MLDSPAICAGGTTARPTQRIKLRMRARDAVSAVPASLALFALSILGNSIFIYTSDRIREYRAGGPV